MKHDSPRFPHKILILGITLLLLGGLLLIWRLERFPSMGALWPLPLILAGLVFLYLVFIKNHTRLYTPAGALLTAVGIFLLLRNTVIPNVDMEQIWPLFMMITGFAILPYSARKSKNKRVAVIIPAVAIIGLSIIFLPFSLGLIDRNFISFVLQWWPTILLLIGALLVLSYYIRKER